MTTILTRLAVLLIPATAFSMFPVASTEAQEDKLSFVFTPQLWLSNIPKSGFSPPAKLSAVPYRFTGDISGLLRDGQTDPTSIFFPQWGGQFAAQYHQWTLGVAAQYVSYETRTDILATEKLFETSGIPEGTKINTENIRTDRVDVDLTLTYFIPDVIRDVLDVSAGAGFKWIRASGHRLLTGNNQFQALDYQLKNGNFVNKASFLDNLYGATIPTTLNFHLTRDSKWLIPVTMTPFLGYEGNSDQVNGWKSSFAYGGTFDAGIRYVFDNGVALYGGYRAQVIQGNNLYFAQGPLFNVSVRFGGK